MQTPSAIRDKKIVLHKGVFKPIATVPQAVFVITGMTIGAGVLGIPYVVSRVGLAIGISYIFLLGLVTLGLNLMIGEIAVRTRNEFQLPGLAGKYLGNWARYLLSVLFIFGTYGSMLAYIIGEGQSLSAIFGGNPMWWAVFFWSIGSVIVWRGLRAVKLFENIIGSVVIIIIAALSFYLLPHLQIPNLYYTNTAEFFLPLGVILFALSNATGVVEAHALLPGSQRHFRKALIIGTLIPVALYILFALAVAGSQGLGTTEIATVGLGGSFGPFIAFVANLCAILAMGTVYVGGGIVLKQTLIWDDKINKFLAEVLVIFLPLALYLAGIRDFVGLLGIIGGLFFGLQSLIMVAACWRARSSGDLNVSRYNLRHFWLLAVPVFIVFLLVILSSVWKFF